jgi:hypothetical protein
MAATSDVFGKAHDEGILIGHGHDHGRDATFSESLERLEPTFATNEHIAC